MKTPAQNISSTLQGKKVLFLEDSNSLNNGLDRFEEILISSGIEYGSIFNISEVPMDKIVHKINQSDAIVFQTQWVTDISRKLFDYIRSLKDKKIVIECYINEPTWYYKNQHGSKHDVYIFTCYPTFDESDEFYKLTNKPYWNYKNKFNK